MSDSHRAYVALGANLDDPQQQVRQALAALADLPQSHLRAASSLYRTAPVGVHNQPDFINAVAALDTGLDPEALLQALFALEARFGRRRDTPLAPRTLDLDLLLYDQQSSHSATLILPHPRMHQRAFVLLPLLEIAPDIKIPGHGPAAGLLAAVADQGIARLA